MRTALLSLVLVAISCSIARADVIPSCPPGQHLVMNPVAPGAMHHGGGGCVADTAPPPDAVETEAEPAQTRTGPAHSLGEAPETAEAPSSSGGCSVGATHARSRLGLGGLFLLALAVARRRASVTG